MGLTRVLYKINIHSELLLLIFLLTIPTILFADLLVLLQLRLGLNVSEKNTPKSFSSLASGIFWSSSSSSSLTFYVDFPHKSAGLTLPTNKTNLIRLN